VEKAWRSSGAAVSAGDDSFADPTYAVDGVITPDGKIGTLIQDPACPARR
jgi:hypothetical protein